MITGAEIAEFYAMVTADIERKERRMMANEIREGAVFKWVGPDQRTREQREHKVVVARVLDAGNVIVQDEVGYAIWVSPDSLLPLGDAAE